MPVCARPTAIILLCKHNYYVYVWIRYNKEGYRTPCKNIALVHHNDYERRSSEENHSLGRQVTIIVHGVLKQLVLHQHCTSVNNYII